MELARGFSLWQRIDVVEKLGMLPISLEGIGVARIGVIGAYRRIFVVATNRLALSGACF